MQTKTENNITISASNLNQDLRIAYDPSHTIDAIRYCYNDIYQTQKALEEKKLEIIKVIFNDPATIVFWSDGDKTVVKCCDNDIFDPEKGLAMAISKKFIGSTRLLDKLVKTYYKEDKQECFVDSDSLNAIASTFAKLGNYIGGRK